VLPRLDVGPVLSAGAAVAILASAACAAPPAAQAWDGVWSPIENNMFDPSGGRVDPNFGREYPPYKPEWEKRYVATLEASRAGKPTDPTAACVPPGMPRMMASPYAQELIIKDRQVTLLKEYQSQVRRIYTDGRTAPADADPSFNGYSVGHWEGDTLVVQTTHMRGDTVFDRTSAPHSDQIAVTERMRLKSPDVWQDVITVTDSVAFTKPWIVTRTYKREPSWDVLEYVCEENNRNAPTANGVNQVLPKAK
jgi:hypothetical protein